MTDVVPFCIEHVLELNYFGDEFKHNFDDFAIVSNSITIVNEAMHQSDD